MCGRYSLALRPSQVRRYLENEHLPVFDAPEDDADDAPRQSYNFAPGYHGIVYRADIPDWGTASTMHKANGGEEETSDATTTSEKGPGTDGFHYKLQSMKWGLIPFWTKRNPDYGSVMKTINCRDDSLIENRGMWTSMKNKKRCIVVAQGFYEWLKKGKEKVPHYTKRKDGKLMCFAGLWDCVQYEGSDDKHYTYTIITTSSNKQLKFLHDRMPVILETEDIKTWLDPNTTIWTKQLQTLLKPSNTELDIYAVSKEVGKVGNNSPTFIIPVASSENKSNIANFFAKGALKEESTTPTIKLADKSVKNGMPRIEVKSEPDETRETVDHDGTEDNAPLPVPVADSKKGIKKELDDVPETDTKRGMKRELDDISDKGPSHKAQKTSPSPNKTSPAKPTRNTRSSTTNNTASPSTAASKGKGSRKITSFFSK